MDGPSNALEWNGMVIPVLMQRSAIREFLSYGEMAERSKALDWNSSNIFTGVPGFESLSLRQK